MGPFVTHDNEVKEEYEKLIFNGVIYTHLVLLIN